MIDVLSPPNTFALLFAALGLAGLCCNTGCAAEPPKGVTQIKHRGLPAVEVRAKTTTLIAVPAWAGRLSVLDFGAGNVLWQDPRIDGKTLPADAPWMPWDGNATDVVSAAGAMQWLDLWLRPYPQVRTFDYGVEFQSAPDPKAQLTLAKRYQLAPDGRHLTYSATATHVGSEPAAWTLWERAQLLVPRYLIAPLDKSGPFPAGYTLRGAAKEAPPKLVQVVAGDYLVLRPGSQEGLGLSARLRAGWVAIVHDKAVLLIQYPIDPAGDYPHFGGGNFMPWIGETAIEVEPITPQKLLKTGQSLSLVQTWRWLPLPPDLDASNPAALGPWLDQQVEKMGSPLSSQ